MSSPSQVAVVRTFLYRVVIIVILIVLGVQLWRLQIGQGQDLRALADSNRFREVTEPAARGVIYDRSDRILARNRPTFAVMVVPADLPDDEAQLDAAIDQLLTLLLTPVEPVVAPTATVTPTVTAPPTRRPAGRTPDASAVISATATPAGPPAPPRLPLTFDQLQTVPRAPSTAHVRPAANRTTCHGKNLDA